MVKLRNLDTTPNEEKFKRIKDIIEYYDDGTHNGEADRWHGETFDNLMSHSTIRLKNIHIHLMKKKQNAESIKKG